MDKTNSNVGEKKTTQRECAGNTISIIKLDVISFTLLSLLLLTA